eukprot:UN33513
MASSNSCNCRQDDSLNFHLSQYCSQIHRNLSYSFLYLSHQSLRVFLSLFCVYLCHGVRQVLLTF